MPNIYLPDGNCLEYPQSISIAEIASDIGSGLARAALAGMVDDRLVDTDFRIDEDARIRIITGNDPEGLEIIRHSCAHLMAQAVKQLYPDAQVTIGPVVEDGFYYDFAFPERIGEEDLDKIEAMMVEMANADLPVTRKEFDRDAAVKFFADGGESYKAEIIQEIPEGEVISLYSQGEFTDLCRGPHVPSTGRLKAFKLTKLAGAYWRGDSSNEMLQRVYGTAWPDQKQLKAYLKRIEEAEKRDHRKLGRELGYFHFQEEAPGMAFWHQNAGRFSDRWRLTCEICWLNTSTKRFIPRRFSTGPCGSDQVTGTNSGTICSRRTSKTMTMQSSR